MKNINVFLQKPIEIERSIAGMLRSLITNTIWREKNLKGNKKFENMSKKMFKNIKKMKK